MPRKLICSFHLSVWKSIVLNAHEFYSIQTNLAMKRLAPVFHCLVSHPLWLTVSVTQSVIVRYTYWVWAVVFGHVSIHAVTRMDTLCSHCSNCYTAVFIHTNPNCWTICTLQVFVSKTMRSHITNEWHRVIGIIWQKKKKNIWKIFEHDGQCYRTTPTIFIKQSLRGGCCTAQTLSESTNKWEM